MTYTHEIVTVVIAYYESVIYAKQAAALFPQADGSYRGQWVRRLEKGFAHAWGKMDYDIRRIYFGLAEEFAEEQAEALEISREKAAGE